MEYSYYDSPVGRLLLTSEHGALTGLWMDARAPEGASREEDNPVLIQTKNWLDGYFRGEPPEIDFPLAPEGTAFQCRVWQILLAIPYGETRSYGDIAREH